MANPFNISDKKLQQLTNDYRKWAQNEEREHSKSMESFIRKINFQFLEKAHLESVSNDEFYEELHGYTRAKEIDGPVYIMLGEPTLKASLEEIKLNLLYLIETDQSPFEIAEEILEGSRKIQKFSKSFWTPIFYARFPNELPLWNNKTTKFFKKLGINLSTSRTSTREKYQQLSEAFNYFKKINPSLSTLDIDHLVHFGESSDEGKELIQSFFPENQPTNNFSNKKPIQESFKSPPLNQILYGPPGTGKTYSTKTLALSIVEELSEEQLKQKYSKRDEVNKRFKEYLKSNQISFVTFHQSFSYEDFIEGIKPVLDGADETGNETSNSEIKYEISDGIFKRIAERARNYQAFEIEKQNLQIDTNQLPNIEKSGFFKMSLGDSNRDEDNPIYKYCIENNCLAMGWGQNVNFEDIQNENEIEEVFEKQGVKPESQFELFAVKCFKFWMKEGDIVFISNGNTSARAIGVIEGDYKFKPDTKIRYNQFRKVRWLLKDVNIPVDKLYSRRFSQQTIYKMYTELVKKEFLTSSTANKSEGRNHVLIIDEINRGNIASIFGELITLIEEDKREGGTEPLSVKLPYSKEYFSVPDNLYLIGTMNTADRSVEALDTALRRRFSFVPLYPSSEKLNDVDELFGDELNLIKLLETINDRLEILINADHQIGHSYFLKISEFKGDALEALSLVFQNEIIPLLQEYFYGDYEKIGMVLGNGFITLKEVNSVKGRFAKDFQGLSPDYEGKKLYRFTPSKSWTLDTFKSIYGE